MVVVSTLEEKLRKSLFLSFSSEMKRLYRTLRLSATQATTYFDTGRKALRPVSRQAPGILMQ